MRLSKILVPVDFSTSDRAVLEFAASLARDQHAELIVLHVEEPPLAYGGGELYYGIEQPSVEDLQAMLMALTPNDKTIPVHHRLLNGDPANTIVRIAAEEGADLIVLGTHGRTGVLRMIMGSVAEVVVRKAHCPVLTLRQPVPERIMQSAEATT